jgi:hypothetical protein
MRLTVFTAAKLGPVHQLSRAGQLERYAAQMAAPLFLPCVTAFTLNVQKCHSMPLPPLYKYLDVRGAQLTLGNRTFKHAKPSDFNDTEDLTVQSIFWEETEVALRKLTLGFTDVTFQHLSDPPTCNSPMKEKVALIQHAFLTNPKAADMIKAELIKEGREPIFDVDYMRKRAEEILKEINERLQAIRVLCVTTHKDSDGLAKPKTTRASRYGSNRI